MNIGKRTIRMILVSGFVMCAAMIFFSQEANAQITVNNVRVLPAFQHIMVGVYINPGANTNATMTVTYRKVGDTIWLSGHPGMRSTNDPYWISTIVMRLVESTDYQVHVVVTDPGGVTNGDQTYTVRTRSSSTPTVTGQTWYIAPTGNDTTGNGSSGNPWKSITRADQSALPGNTVIIRGGTYSCNQEITNGGSAAGGYILYRAASGETPVFDCSDPLYVVPNSGNHFVPVSGHPGVYSTSLSYAPAYVASGDERLYNYSFDESASTPLDALTSGTVTHNSTAYAVAGWLYQSGLLYVHLNSDVDPDTVSMHVVDFGPAISLWNPDYIAVVGLTIRYADTGIRLRGDHTATPVQPAGRNAWIDSNTLHHTNGAISTIGWLDCTGTVSTDASIGAPGAVIIRNTMYDSVNTTAWPWDIKKGSDVEVDGISIKAGDGVIVRGNTIHDTFNGISASNWGDCFWGNFPIEGAGMNRHAVIEMNTLADIGDDVVEPEGAIINFLIYANKSIRTHTGISMAPIGEGPVWVIRNEVVDYLEGCLKFWDGMNVNRGWMLIYHNTMVSRLTDAAAMLVYPASDYTVKVKFRNNIFMGTGMAVDQGDTNWGNPNVTLNYDNFYTTATTGQQVMWFYQGTVTCGGGGNNDHCWYDTVPEWITDSAVIGQPQEQNGFSVNPLFVNLPGNDFHLSASSQMINHGIVITGINENYYETAPDLGAYEYQPCSASFNDVPCNYWAYSYIETLVSQGITSGCQASPPLFCPENNVHRDQMAVFIINSMSETPVSPCTGVFLDVPPSYWACGHIERMSQLGITQGCTSVLYCPANNVQRDSMAVFLIRAINETPVTPCTGVFLDVPPTHWACGYIERLVQLGITSGCTTNYYCPMNNVTRAQMSKFLVLAFNF